jgi:hypothetical protein
MKMNVLGSLAIGLIGLAGAQARAAYLCDSQDTLRPDDKIEIVENSESAAKIQFLTFGSQFEFSGPVVTEPSFFGKHQHMELSDSQGNPMTLDVSVRVLVGRGGCGRLGCDPGGGGGPNPKIISAKLNYPLQGLQDVLFSCVQKEI